MARSTPGRVATVAELDATPGLAVVINVGTDVVTTLALASAVEHAPMPVLLVNCDPTVASSAHFDRLAERLGFTIVDAPTLRHFETLDRIFEDVRSDAVLLLDSDAEILGPAVVPRMLQSLERDTVFGAGYVQGPMWLDERSGVAPSTCMYQERAWLPCVLFRTRAVREAFEAGITFAPRTIYNDFMWSTKLSKLLAARFQTKRVPDLAIVRRLPAPARVSLRNARFEGLAWARRDFYGHRPNYVACDTGADLYQWCKYQRGLLFAGVPYPVGGQDEVNHYGGVTRIERGRTRSFAVGADEVEDDAIDRLRRRYGIAWHPDSPETYDGTNQAGQ